MNRYADPDPYGISEDEMYDNDLRNDPEYEKRWGEDYGFTDAELDAMAAEASKVIPAADYEMAQTQMQAAGFALFDAVFGTGNARN